MKKISNYINALIGKGNTPFLQKVNSSSLMNNTPIILMTDILYLIECFEGYGPECQGIYLTGQEYLQQFFQELSQKPLSGLMAVKISLTIHLVLYEFQIGEIVAEEMISRDYKLQVIETQSHGQFVQNYLMYLFKLAQNLKLFYSCKIGQYPIFDQEVTYTNYSESTRENQINQFKMFKKQQNFKDTNLQYREYQQKKLETHLQNKTGYITIDQKILYLFKLLNLLNQCIQILNLCIGVCQIEQQDIKNIYIEISCVLWNDTMVMYKFATLEICKILDSFRFLPLQQLQSLQQVYWATTNSTKSIKWIYNNRKYFDSQNIVKQPYWFEENNQIIRDIQNSIIDSKMNSIPESCRQLKLQTPQSSKLKSPMQIQQPYSGRILNQRNQPFFIAHKKLQESISQYTEIKDQSQQQNNQKNNNIKHAIYPIFSDEEMQLSPKIQQQELIK
ncbi:unnamed protein product [Paramecium primaurelia]|uniref:Uncharacterized protein n=2 Tax=Paramecium TaxID=5884 RepID=A0A8S1VX89_9CILI|nr:unnamed protein product [Paramecium primaurelia]CAD8178856.1 unnamed protein product [Paramecium pentaurelia]